MNGNQRCKWRNNAAGLPLNAWRRHCRHMPLPTILLLNFNTHVRPTGSVKSPDNPEVAAMIQRRLFFTRAEKRLRVRWTVLLTVIGHIVQRQGSLGDYIPVILQFQIFSVFTHWIWCMHKTINWNNLFDVYIYQTFWTMHISSCLLLNFSS